ncbi:hypothetical protein D3C75_855330 [compost metagenome]
MPGVLVAVDRLVGAFVDLHQARRLRMGRRHRVVLQLAEAAGEGHVIRTRNVLIAQEQHLVLQQQSLDLVEQAVVVDGIGEVHADQLGADTAGEWFYAHLVVLLRGEGRSAGHCASRANCREGRRAAAAVRRIYECAPMSTLQSATVVFHFMTNPGYFLRD